MRSDQRATDYTTCMRLVPALCGATCATIALMGASCGGEDARGGQPLRVLAAASLADVIVELADRFEREADCRVVVSVGGSGSLRRQIEMGAPADVFVSADARQVAMLQRGGRTAPDSIERVAGNRLVIVVAQGADSDITSPADLRAPRVRRIAIANPEYAPAGRYAKEALIHCGVWADLEGKLVLAENVRHAALHARSGAVDAALVFESDLLGTDGLRRAHLFAADAHQRIDYVGAAIATTKHLPLARRFIEYLADDRNADTWRAHGFLPARSEESGS